VKEFKKVFGGSKRGENWPKGWKGRGGPPPPPHKQEPTDD